MRHEARHSYGTHCKLIRIDYTYGWVRDWISDPWRDPPRETSRLPSVSDGGIDHECSMSTSGGMDIHEPAVVPTGTDATDRTKRTQYASDTPAIHDVKNIRGKLC